MDKEYPVAVVGAGAGGLPAAVALVEQGIKVVLIDRGEEVAADSFFTNRYDYELKSSPWEEHSDEWGGPAPLQRGFGLGGSTLFFQAVAEFAPDSVLKQWGLPLPVMHLLRREVAEFLQLAGEVQPPHKINPVSEHLLSHAKRMGWSTHPSTVAILSQSHGGRPSCNHCGLCVYGCRPSDKGSTNNTWLPRLRKAGNNEILLNSYVERIELASRSKIAALKIRAQNRSYRLPVRAVIVAAGAMETPALLRRSVQSHATNGIGNEHVGHNLIGNIWHSLLVTLPKTVQNGQAGIPIDIIVDEFYKQGIMLCQSRNAAGILGPVSAAKFANHVDRGNVRSWMRDNYPRLAGLAGYAESSVSFDDGISQSGNKEYHKTLRDEDFDKLKTMRSLLTQWSNSSGARILNEFGSFQTPFTGAMFRGTCRMGSNKAYSAVDPYGLLHGYENIYISDASVIGAGLVAHPSFLIQVLGVYIGRHLARRLKSE